MLMLRSLPKSRSLLRLTIKSNRAPSRRQSTTSSGPETPHPLSQPTSNTPNHHDLPSFLSYAARIGLDPTSTVYVGTHYEYTVQTALRRLRLSLTRVGGRSDAGIDLLGHWHLPPDSPHPLRVLVQCKALKDKAKPNLVRELGGMFAGAPAGWRSDRVLGMLVSPREATRGLREAMGKSAWPLVWAMVGLEGGVRQCLWNQRAVEVGLVGVGVTVRYLPSEGGEGVKSEVALTWKGEVMEEPRDVGQGLFALGEHG